MNLSDKYLVAFILTWLCQTGWFWYRKQYEFASLWLIIFAAVGSLELLSWIRNGRTMTQLMEAYIQQHPVEGLSVLGFMLLNWLLLLIHLGISPMLRRFYKG